MEPIRESVKTLATEIMQIDKFNLFIGTLCRFIKSIGFYDPNEKTFIKYTTDSSLLPITLAELK